MGFVDQDCGGCGQNDAFLQVDGRMIGLEQSLKMTKVSLFQTRRIVVVASLSSAVVDRGRDESEPLSITKYFSLKAVRFREP